MKSYAEKAKAAELEDEMRPEYDFIKLKFVGRGVYARRFSAGTNIALLDRDTKEIVLFEWLKRSGLTTGYLMGANE